MYERMLNKLEKPSIKDLSLHCGSQGVLFESLNSFLTEGYDTSQEIRFPYGNSYGWGITHRKSKKLICDVFAEAEAFTVMLRLSNPQFETVYDKLTVYTKELIDHKYPCSNGGWIHYRVIDAESLKDIEMLLTIKCK